MKNRLRRSLVPLAALALIVAGCGGVEEYPISGTVTAIDSEKGRITLDHDTIPGVMPAMEMDFPVSDPKLLEGISVGDEVEGRLTEADELTITRLQKP